MDSDRHEDSGEIYSPDEQGEYMLLNGTPRFSMQGLSHTLVDVGEGITEPPTEEYAMMLEVMMADHPGQPCPPTSSWNVGMVMHILKGNPILRELEHVQVDGPGTAYLLFYDRQGHHGLSQESTYTIQAHVKETFSEWISHSAHFAVSLLPLVVAWTASGEYTPANWQINHGRGDGGCQAHHSCGACTSMWTTT